VYKIHLSKLRIQDSPDYDEDNQLISEQLFSNRIPTLKSVTLDSILYYETEIDSSNTHHSLHCDVGNAHDVLERKPKLTIARPDVHENTDLDRKLFLHIPSTLSYLQGNSEGNVNFDNMNTVTELLN
jgi:hypothetical protein